jgi:hypothetical protein
MKLDYHRLLTWTTKSLVQFPIRPTNLHVLLICNTMFDAITY